MNASELKALKPKKSLYRRTCGGGLYIEVCPNASMLWRFRYWHNGRENMLSLGRYPRISLKKARELRDVERDILDEGVDPGEQRRKERAKEAGENAFKFVATEFFDAHARKAPVGAEASKVRFERWVYPYVGDRDIDAINFSELMGILKRLEMLERFDTAKSVRADIARVYRYAKASGKAKTDPTPTKDALLPYVATPFPNPDPKEVPGILRAVDDYKYPLVRAALQLLPLTMTRPGEIAGLEWAEVLDDEIRLPTTRTKEKRAKVIPLSTQARAILDEVHELTGGGKYVFPSVRSASRCMSNNTLNAALRRMGFTREELVAHSFRKIASTGLHELGGYDSLWIEKQMGHTDLNKVRAVYNAAEYLPQRRKMLQAWGDHLTALKVSN